MRHDRRIAFSCDMSHKRINESARTGLEGKTRTLEAAGTNSEAQNWQSVCRRGPKKQYSPLGAQADSLAQAQSTFSTCGRRGPAKILFSSYLRLVAELGRRPSIPSPDHGRDSGTIPKRPSDGTAPEMSQPTAIQILDTAIWRELGVEEVE